MTAGIIIGVLLSGVLGLIFFIFKKNKVHKPVVPAEDPTTKAELEEINDTKDAEEKEIMDKDPSDYNDALDLLRKYTDKYGKKNSSETNSE